mgnify:CR=1 FL=1
MKKKIQISKENINPDAVIKRGYLKENIRIFSLNSIESQSIPPHYHEFHKLIQFKEGRLDYIVEGKRYHLIPGDTLVIPAFCIHQPIIEEKTPYKRIVLWIKPEAVTYLGIQESFSSPHLVGRKPAKNEDEIISKIISEINSSLTTELSIKYLCEKYFISESRLIVRFKKVTGVTPHKYILQKRLAIASKLLSEGETAADAARKSGFNDYSSFYRAFLKEYGISPRAY